MAVDAEKVFDSVKKTFGFGKGFLKWIQILLTNQESCGVNGGTDMSYFR